jgi:hypothetical protein
MAHESYCEPNPTRESGRELPRDGRTTLRSSPLGRIPSNWRQVNSGYRDFWLALRLLNLTVVTPISGRHDAQRLGSSRA